MIEHKTIEPETKTAIVMSRDAIDALRRFVDLLAGGEGVIQLEPASEPGPALAWPTAPEPAPEPAWPTAPYVWWDGYLWGVTGGGRYVSVVGNLHSPDLTNPDPETRDELARFAREAVPVVVVPAAGWETWKHTTRDLDYTPGCELIDAVDSLAQEVAR